MIYVSYYRVSTKRQSLGLDAQRATVSKYVKANGGKVIAEFSEKESGKLATRPKLHEALALCRKSGATLLIAKLDRLSRNVSFIFTLKDNGCNFVACDLPEFNTLTLAIFAGMAQQEAELISMRTKEALAALKAKGKKLGRNKGEGCELEIRLRGLEVRRENTRNNPANIAAWNHVELCMRLGMNWSGIVRELNGKGFRTAKNGVWNVIQIQRLVKLMKGHIIPIM